MKKMFFIQKIRTFQYFIDDIKSVQGLSFNAETLNLLPLYDFLPQEI